nr:glycosyltransferase [Candidatus Levybacteria bacterium]
MKTRDLLILSWHQVYLSSNAGGYVRLREFIKRVPKDISFMLLDNNPTIFNDIVDDANLKIFDTPSILKKVKHFFLPWLLLETLFTGFIIYRIAQKIIVNNNCKVLYVPIGEFPQLYIPAIFLKIRFPQIKLVVDILNYEVPDNNVINYYKNLRKNGIGIFRGLITIIMYFIGYFLTNITISRVDYIFTVSPELVGKIKKKYRKQTINYTPSGVNSSFDLKYSKTKEYRGIYVGRITAQKGVYDLVHLWSKYTSHNPSAKLAIVGSTDDENKKLLKLEISKRKLQKNIDVFFDASNEVKNKILSQSAMFLHMAKYEPLFPVIGILEGLAYGLPVILYDMNVIPRNLDKSNASNFIYVVNSGDIDKVLSVIKQYSTYSDDKKNNIFQAARKYANGYDWDTIAAKEFKIITQMIKK